MVGVSGDGMSDVDVVPRSLVLSFAAPALSLVT